MKTKIIILILVVILAGAGFWYWYFGGIQPVDCGGIAGLRCSTGYECKYEGNYPDASGVCVKSKLKSAPLNYQTYRNDSFGFYISLPDSWKGYTVNHIKEDIYDVTGKVTTNNGVVDSFQIIELHHPLETSQNPREDMPVMVFTPAQWGHIQKGEWSVGAAPIPPSLLGQNSKYIIALPARYNYDYKTGWEEVDQLVHALKAFEPTQ